VCAIIAAAGWGRRFEKDVPKQFYKVDGESPIKRAVRALLSSAKIDGVLCVVPDGFRDLYYESVGAIEDARLMPPVTGGGTRCESVGIGLTSLLSSPPDFVLIHDAARCFCANRIVEEVIANLEGGEGAVVPCIPATDSVRVCGKHVARSEVMLAQTPQGFKYELIRNLHAKYRGCNADDDASLCDLENIEVKMISGDKSNKKITFKDDVLSFRTGFGFDIHKFSTDSTRGLYLMGST
jgi:2-C-methyl-D-erythritol 4-phosphate cytidylyltransferase/2-C-methyl-D-erythritol 2,4-cyclodiphosphate synthase